MKVKQLDRHAKIVDKGNEILEAINDLESALQLINSDKKANVTVAVSNNEDIIPISDHIKFTNESWNEIICSRIKDLRKDFKRLRL